MISTVLVILPLTAASLSLFLGTLQHHDPLLLHTSRLLLPLHISTLPQCFLPSVLLPPAALSLSLQTLNPLPMSLTFSLPQPQLFYLLSFSPTNLHGSLTSRHFHRTQHPSSLLWVGPGLTFTVADWGVSNSI